MSDSETREETPPGKATLDRLLALMAGPSFRPGARAVVAAADAMIAFLDEKISAQLSAVMHHPEFRKLESSWRSLEFLVDRIDFRQNILLSILSVSKADLLADFDDTPDITFSGFYRHVYTSEYGQFGGHPIGVVVANYEFDASPPDIRLLSHAAAVAALAHAPFIAGVHQRFFGLSRWADFPGIRDLRALFETPVYAQWRGFRASEDARYVALTLPRFLFRLPYDPATSAASRFSFTEDTEDSEALCWGNTAFALAERMADSFARYRWCVNIVGPEGGGVVENLPLYATRPSDMALREEKIPTEVLLSEQREFELAEEGFVGLAMRKGEGNAVFFSASSCQAAHVYESEDREAALSRKLGVQLPYMMIMNRLAHYIKVLQRENLGTWRTRQTIEAELNRWLNQYVSEMDNPDPITRSRRPLRSARLSITERPDNPSWFIVTIKARPHFKFMGANFTLSLTGKLDREPEDRR
ncbi:MAG: type VI secretion system contractile sheath large subunit [Candidatus Accumulibacter sp.]|jgi:type VI secretion system protein ImpC|nr:type VI secretion system contractile sheath large subunit [Accumulibacter sp.]